MWKSYKINNKLQIEEFYSAFVRYCTPDYAFPGEAHDFWEFVYVMEGSAIISADERVVNLKRNQIIFHKPMEFHTLKPSGSSQTKLFIMSFKVSGTLINTLKYQIFSLQPEQQTKLSAILEYMQNNNNTESENTTPITYLKRLYDESCYGQQLKNLTEIFLMSLIEAERDSAKPIENNETEIYSNAIGFIEKNIKDNISVAQLAKECNVSTAYLKKIFSKYTGLGIHEYILTTKISLAKQLLDSGSSVKSISRLLSFSSQNYFSYAFKRETGHSPSEYKKANK